VSPEQPTHTIEVGLLRRGVARRLLERSDLVDGCLEHRGLLSSSFIVRPAQGCDPLPLLKRLSDYVDR